MPSDVPAICDDCGTMFSSGIQLTGSGTAMLAGNKSGPCPNCGGMGSVPDGLYEWVGETMRVLSSWSPERIRSLAMALETARKTPDRAAAEAAIAADDDLREVAKSLLIPRDAGQFWAFIACLLTLLTLLSASQADQNITVNVQTVIEQSCAKPLAPTTELPRPTVERRDVPKKRKKPKKPPNRPK